MKSLTPEFAGHLAGGATTLARCWIVTRKDALQIGFTDHDRELEVAGVTCAPENGLETTSDASGPGFASGGSEISGAVSSAALTDADLEAGLWDGAEVAVYLVSWSDPDHYLLLRRARIGEVSRKDGAFQAELRGLSHLLETRRGRVFSRMCDADLGDPRCGVDLTDPRYFREAEVVAMTGEARLQAARLEDVAAGWFSGGRFIVLDGECAGFRSEIARQDADAGEVSLVLWQAPPAALVAGTRFTVTAGCDKSYETCRAKFSNGVNFQGFPHMPGTDFVLSYPNRNTGQNDGGPVVS